MAWQGLIEHYKEFLPVTEKTPKLSLLEGNTPLIKLENLSKELGIELYVKSRRMQIQLVHSKIEGWFLL